MGKNKLVWLLGLIALLVLHCGGPKVLTEEELASLPPAEKQKVLENHIEKNPSDEKNYLLLYNLYQQQNNEEKAYQVLQKARANLPGNSRIEFLYGEISIKRGQLKEGYNAFLKILNSPDAYTYKDQIASYIQEKYFVQRLTTDPSDEIYPVFSPDGEWVYFQTDRNGNWDIYRMNLINGNQEEIISGTANEELPWITSDNRYLYFTTDELDKRPLDYVGKSRNIARYDLSEKKKEFLTSTLANDWLPRTNSSGDLIVFVSDREDSRNVPLEEKYSNIFTMEFTGDFQLKLDPYQANSGGAIFSHDGRFVYFHSNKDNHFGIYRYSLMNQKIVGIHLESGSDNVGPCPSPDDSSLVFYSNRNGNYEIYRFHLTDQSLERMTTNPSDDLNPIFSPDGTKIVFFSNRTGNYDLFLLDLTRPTANVTVSELMETLTGLLNSM